MSFVTALLYTFRRSSACRFVVTVVILVVGVYVWCKVNSTATPPVLVGISPEVSSPGEMLTIEGRDFGDKGYIELGGVRLTRSSVVSWGHEKIEVTIPSNARDGLLYVCNSAGRSSPVFWSNRDLLPTKGVSGGAEVVPTISGVVPKNAAIGQVVKITGGSFGNSRGKSVVCFSANRSASQSDEAQYIEASTSDFDYEYWDDGEIRVRVPDGAASGVVFVKTNKGESTHEPLTLDISIGHKEYTGKRSYVVQVSAELDNTSFPEAVELSFNIPRVLVMPSQPMVQMTNVTPSPLVEEQFAGTGGLGTVVVQQASIPKNTQGKSRFAQTFACDIYEERVTVVSSKVRPYSSKVLAAYAIWTRSDELVPSNDPEVIKIARDIVGKETNPYNQAKLVYEYLLGRFTITSQLRSRDTSPLELLSGGMQGADAYDLMVLYCALLRSLKVPCAPIAGVLVDSSLKSQAHWWCEFYIEGVGWIPVDVAMGARGASAKDYYFGNMDSMHIAFSKGYPARAVGSSNNRTHGRKKTYAFLPVWEEVNSTSMHYSFLWSDPIITGVY